MISGYWLSISAVTTTHAHFVQPPTLEHRFFSEVTIFLVFNIILCEDSYEIKVNRYVVEASSGETTIIAIFNRKFQLLH